MYLCFIISLICFFCSSSSSTSLTILASSLSSHVRHQVSYSTLLLVQSWSRCLPVIILVLQVRHPCLLQSSPCQGFVLCSKSMIFVPALSTILILYPVCLPSSSSASLSLFASSPPLVQGMNITEMVFTGCFFSSPWFVLVFFQNLGSSSSSLFLFLPLSLNHSSFPVSFFRLLIINDIPALLYWPAPSSLLFSNLFLHPL